MTSSFESPDHWTRSVGDDTQTHRDGQTAQDHPSLDALQRDRFELLSAYLDSEVTAVERRQVEDWLANDPTTRRLYTRLLRLRCSLQAMPVPASDQPVEQTVEKVFSRLERRPHLTLVWGGAAAIAALFIGTLTTTLPGNNDSLLPGLVQSRSREVPPEELLIALDQPVIEIPNVLRPSAAIQKPDWDISNELLQ